MGAPISGVYNTPHAATLTALIPSWMRYVIKADPKRFARFAHKALGVSETPDVLEDAIAGVTRLEAFYEELHMPTSLSSLGVERDQLGALARKAIGEWRIGSIFPIGAVEIEEIYQSAY